jgi:hypothetical protein
MWIPTDSGAVNAEHVIQIERTANGCVLRMVDGSTARSAMMFEITDDGELRTLEPEDLDDDDSDVPF